MTLPMGFRSVAEFQRAWNLGPALTVDGVMGPRTTAAMQQSVGNGGLISAHFRTAEFSCGCGGMLPGCRTIVVTRELLQLAEAIRGLVGGPLSVVSGYRCPERNRRVGGAADSQHLYGTAMDIDSRVTVGALKALGLATGIGRRPGLIPARCLVRHVDVRPGDPAKPAEWVYSQ